MLVASWGFLLPRNLTRSLRSRFGFSSRARVLKNVKQFTFLNYPSNPANIIKNKIPYHKGKVFYAGSLMGIPPPPKPHALLTKQVRFLLQSPGVKKRKAVYVFELPFESR